MEQKGGVSGSSTHCFTDVHAQSYAMYVCTAKQLGIVTGKPDGSFMPDMPISFVEASAVVVRAEGVRVIPGITWYSPYLQQMAEWNAIPSSITNILDMLMYHQAKELVDAAMDREDDDDGDDEDMDDEDDNDDELDLRVTASDDEVEEGDVVTFRIRLENDDNDDLEDIEVKAFLDKEMEFVSASDNGDYDDDDEEVEWDDIEIEEDETKTLLLTVRIDDADEGDKLTLRVEADNDGSVSKASKVILGEDDDDDDDEGDFKLTVTDSKDPATEDDTIIYTIRIENEDNNEIRVDVVALMDDNMDFVSASDNGDKSGKEVEWDNVRIGRDQIKALTLTIRIDDDVKDGEKIELRVEANEEEEIETTTIDDDADDDNDVNEDEDIDVSIIDSQDPVRRGDTLTYTIRLENEENEDVEIDVSAELDDGMTFLSATQSGDEDDDVVEWEDIEIDEDETRTLQFTVRIKNDVDYGETLRIKVKAGNGKDTETTKVVR